MMALGGGGPMRARGARPPDNLGSPASIAGALELELLEGAVAETSKACAVIILSAGVAFSIREGGLPIT